MLRREITTQSPAQGPSEQGPASASFIQRKIAGNPEFAQKLDQMRLNLSPLVQITTGYIHPAFPRTVLQFWLLTDHQLEELAHFYHQRTPSHLTGQYPCPVNWNSSLPVEDKRRKIGRFIGLRGCESPIWLKTEEEIAEEARLANSADEDEMWRRKMSRGLAQVTKQWCCLVRFLVTCIAWCNTALRLHLVRIWRLAA